MSEKKIKVLAVADPAVKAYVDEKYGILSGFCGKVEFHVVDWENYYPAMMAAFLGKTCYDVVMVAGHLWKCDFVEKGYLAPIDELDDDILPVIAREARYQGKTYLSPSFCDGHMVVYRKSMVKHATGNLFSDIITTDEYITAIRQLAKNTTLYPLVMKAHPSEIFLDALPFLTSGGEDVYDSRLIPQCSAASIVAGLQKYCELSRYAPANVTEYGNTEVADAIAKKKTAVAVTWSGQLGAVMNDCVEKEDIGFSTFSTAWNVSWSFAVCSTSEQQEKAKELLRYLRSPSVDRKVGALSGAPVRKSSYLAGVNQYPWYRCQLKMIEECAKPLPDMKFANDKDDCFYRQIFQAFIGKKTAMAAMVDAEAEIKRLFFL